MDISIILSVLGRVWCTAALSLATLSCAIAAGAFYNKGDMFSMKWSLVGACVFGMTIVMLYLI